MPLIDFFEHPANSDFALNVSEPLPQEFDVPVTRKLVWQFPTTDDSRKPTPVLVRRYRLMTYMGRQVYWWKGTFWR